MPDAQWKATERRIAQEIGGKRRGPTGRDTDDIIHPWLAPECKSTKQMPAYLSSAIQQAVDNARAGKVPVVFIHQTGDDYDDALVVMKLKDWKPFFELWEMDMEFGQSIVPKEDKNGQSTD